MKNCKTIIDFLPTNIILVDQNAHVTYTNQEFKKNFKKAFVQVLEKGPGDLLSCVNSYKEEKGCGYSEDCINCNLRNFLLNVMKTGEQGIPIEVELTIMGEFGEEKRWFEVQVLPISFEEEKEYLITFIDVTVYKADQSILLQHKKLAESANKAKSEFLANMSHEIRTPLNGVIGMLEMTLMTKLENAQRENLEVARNCAETLLALINNILDLSKVESSKVILEEKPFSMKALLQKVVDMHTAAVLEKDLKVEVNLDEKLPPYFCGDVLRLQQVLMNLISNAVKFTQEGKIQIEVKILCSFRDIYTIAFSVEDSGIGIAPKDVTRLFQPFSQVDGTISRKYGGTGLGLAISQNLVNLMGGEIKVKSQKGRGSVFYFTIQIKTADEAEKQNEKPVFEAGKVKQEAILLVEDERFNQIVIRQLLNKLGYHNIDVVETGFQAIQAFETKHYDVILMDIQLPELDGLDTTKIIREREKKKGKKVPIIAVTAHALKGDREKFLEHGMDEYVKKPVNMNELNEAMEKALKQNKFRTKENDLAEVYAFWNPKKAEGSEVKALTKGDKHLLSIQLENLEELFGEQKKTTDAYLKIEKAAHELKIRAQKKDYDNIKADAFRIELAARKKDDASIKKAFEALKALVC